MTLHPNGPPLRLFATDLANHLACAHLTELDRAVAEGRRPAPVWRDPTLALLRERGAAHERAYVEHLRAGGVSIVELGNLDTVAAAVETEGAMRQGRGAIVQAGVESGRWVGRADVLLRVTEPSELGAWSYVVVDTKLAQETRAGTVLQLCLYTEHVGRIQGRTAATMHVVKPGPDFPCETFRWDDFQAYYRLVRRRLEEVVTGPYGEAPYPYPIAHCDICRWRLVCDRRRRADDHLSLVAGIHTLHIHEIERQGSRTLEQFATAPRPLGEPPQRGSLQAFERAHGQARVQYRGRVEDRPVYVHLPLEPGVGLARLPEPCAGDVFFDIESDPFVGTGGIEYLLGTASTEARDEPAYQAAWALDLAGERRVFERFMDGLMERWDRHPGMHVYHFSPYEPAALKRLSGRHATREAELDRLLRGERFVDLLSVVRRGLQASVESYSLKQLERLYGFGRSVELPQASAALRRVAAALERGAPGEIMPADRVAVESYNRDDCLSTAALREWLEQRRAELAGQGTPVGRPELKNGEASERVEERAAETRAIFDLLASGLPADRATWSPADQARWLLALELDYFRREEKSAWWEYHRIHELDYEDLLDERSAVAGLSPVDALPAKGRIERYRFPPQECTLRSGDDLHEVRARKSVGKVHEVDARTGLLAIKKTAAATGRHPAAVMVNEVVRPRPIDTSLLALGSSVAERGVEGAGPYRAARDLLLRRPPRRAGAAGPLLRPGEELVEGAVRLARELDHGVLPIQGPPGTGKTYTGARMILALARDGKRIGVTAVGHKVIRNLLEEVLRAAALSGVSVPVTHKVKASGQTTPPGPQQEGRAQGALPSQEGRAQGALPREVEDNEAARQAVGAGRVVGGTAWLWSREDFVESVDYLFVDEAGQMSLAHTLGASRCAHNLVLLGDPQQLEQPQRGSHPEDADVAALVHMLHGRKTIRDEDGIFLDLTWRLHPRICAFTTEVFYEGRLRPRPGLERQAIGGPTPFAGCGLFYVPVEHRGNQSVSPEETRAVERIVAGLLRRGVSWTNAEGTVQGLREEDLLVVAPYNAQVAAIADRVPAGVRVGTVDRFQGQEAPVVIYSMTSSSAQDAPRGMGFLYNPNRLNVATSRARCVCILVASPRLLEPDCRTPEQMRWSNGLCRYRELAQLVPEP